MLICEILLHLILISGMSFLIWYLYYVFKAEYNRIFSDFRIIKKHDVYYTQGKWFFGWEYVRSHFDYVEEGKHQIQSIEKAKLILSEISEINNELMEARGVKRKREKSNVVVVFTENDLILNDWIKMHKKKPKDHSLIMKIGDYYKDIKDYENAIKYYNKIKG
jgi:tetratricopeptide (TPR) repeat protein